MRLRTIWLAAIFLLSATASLEIVVNGVESTWLDIQSTFYRTLLSPVALLAVLCTCTIFAAVGIWLADLKRRSSLEGFLLGLLLGPLGILIEASLPDLGKFPRRGPRASATGER